jgi:hypothetical protein
VSESLPAEQGILSRPLPCVAAEMHGSFAGKANLLPMQQSRATTPPERQRPAKMAGRSGVSSHVNSAAEPPTSDSHRCPANSELLQCGISLEHERSDGYVVHRSNAVPDRAVCFLGRFLPKLGGALAPPFFCVTSRPSGGKAPSQRKTAWATARCAPIAAVGMTFPLCGQDPRSPQGSPRNETAEAPTHVDHLAPG